MASSLNFENLSSECRADSGDNPMVSFETGGLILRGMPRSDIFYASEEGKPKLTFKAWDAEFKLMQSQEGIRALSASLILKGCKVDPYTNKGLLFDASRVQITHVYKGDAGTSVNSDGTVEGDAGLLCEDLEDLKRVIAENPNGTLAHSYNELKINARLDAISGLFFTIHNKSSDEYLYTKLEMLAWKKYIFEQYGRNLPVYEYERDGRLSEVDTSKEALATSLHRLPRDRWLRGACAVMQEYVSSRLKRTKS